MKVHHPMNILIQDSKFTNNTPQWDCPLENSL